MHTALLLTPAEHQTLVDMRDRHPRPYLRERAGALVKIAAGHSPRQVARSGLTRPRHPDTVNAWLHAFRTGGLGALYQAPRRRAFSP
ncbi:MAG: helix-turn-helix domain-containing protein [Armatimonadota bacterium]